MDNDIDKRIERFYNMIDRVSIISIVLVTIIIWAEVFL